MNCLHDLDLKDCVKVFGMATLLASYLVLFSTFLGAYSHPDKTTIVSINSMGEAWYELIMLTLGFPCALYFIREGLRKDDDIWKP